MLCCSCTTTEEVTAVTAEKPAVAEPKPAAPEPAKPRPVAVERKPREPAAKPAGEAVVVAEIGDYVITKDELEQRLINKLSTFRDEQMPNAETVLLEMVAEKAMIMEGREQNLLKGDAWTRRFYEQKLTGLLLQTALEGKLSVTDSEIDAAVKANPRLDRARARASVERAKAGRLVDEFFNEISKKLHVKKLRENLPKAVQIHQRLLYEPKEQRRGYWITNQQLREELTQGEKDIVLATFDGGKITLLDWFETLNQMSPPSRPKDLDTEEGIERLLERAMRMPIFIAEAKSRGLDKDKRFLQEVGKREDRILLGKVRGNVFKDIKRPTEEESIAYFNKHKEDFMSPDTLKIEQIWCEDLETARKVKNELDGGGDFESVKQQYSLNKAEKAIDITAGRERVFFKDLWEAEPNQIAGPVKGFYRSGGRRQAQWQIRWRIVKILEKRPGEMREYSKEVGRDVNGTIQQRQREAAMTKYRKELLARHRYRIYSERIRDIEPFDIP
jgi:peptidyl-prolyl cis-trans isomerase C